MKIYAVADIHGAQYRVNEIYSIIQSYKPDIIAICGDVTQFGPGDIATNILDQLPGIVLVVTGNIDPPDVLDGIKQSHAVLLNQKRYLYQGVSFLGLNGVNDKETNNFSSNPENLRLLEDLDVLITHVPPYGFQDTVFFGKHAGSKIIAEIVNRFKPRLVLCGHIHENPGFTRAENILIVNCSMGKRGKGAFIEINKKITVKMVD